ncbi:flippase [Methylophilus sp. 3sh_L]|uniref:flippase n=1 Tax=Methylophilus sp. 3sh_L TaxID=3377114 RepID=UPI00398EBA14
MMHSKKIISNSVINLLGQVIPFLTALLCIPLIIKDLGVDRFGILNLIWIIVGYFSFLDLGLGRAITQVISSKNDLWPHEKIVKTVWATIYLISTLSITVSFVLLFYSSEIANKLPNIPSSLIEETILSVKLIALTIPLVVISSVLRGVLEGFHAFKEINLIRIPLGVFTFASPLIIIATTPALQYAVGLILFSRFLNVLVMIKMSSKYLPFDTRSIKLFDFSDTANLIKQGGAITISNVIANLIVYLDKFVVGYIVSAAAVAYYATTYEVVTKLWLIPAGLTGVLFPVFAKLAAKDQHKSNKIFITSLKTIIIFTLPFALLLAFFSKEILTLWIGLEFAKKSFEVIQILCIGVFINCLAHIPFTYIQSQGQSYRIALLHTVELTLYIPLAIFLTQKHGIIGTAIAWNIRSILDFIALIFIYKTLHEKQPSFKKQHILTITLMSSTLMMPLVIELNSLLKISSFVLIVLAILFISWTKLLDKDERYIFRKAFNRN